jgi:hypothetical protein
MSITTIKEVMISPGTAGRLWGCSVDSPQSGSQHDTYCIDLAGWVLGRSSTIRGIEVFSEGQIRQTATVGQTRPDIAHAFPAVPAAGASGFRTQVNLVALPPDFELTLLAVHDNGQRSPFGTISGNRSRLGIDDSAMIQPLLVRTIGRTGSTWFMRILGQHPRIATYRPFEFESRAGMYWVHVFRALSAPKSYLQPLIATDPFGRWWLGPETMAAPPYIPDPEVLKFLGATCIRSLAAFCQQQLDQLYRAVAAAVGCPAASYFAEKYVPDPAVPQMLWEWYPKAKEVILVRDPRDIFCSIESFNAKRGYLAFARDQVTNEIEYSRKLIQGTHRLLRTWKARPTAVHLLRYEDLVREPARTLTTLLHYLEIDSGAEVVDGILQRASLETTAMNQHRTSRTAADSIGRWQRELPANLRDLFVSECAETLAQLGYQ